MTAPIDYSLETPIQHPVNNHFRCKINLKPYCVANNNNVPFLQANETTLKFANQIDVVSNIKRHNITEFILPSDTRIDSTLITKVMGPAFIYCQEKNYNICDCIRLTFTDKHASSEHLKQNQERLMKQFNQASDRCLRQHALQKEIGPQARKKVLLPLPRLPVLHRLIIG